MPHASNDRLLKESQVMRYLLTLITVSLLFTQAAEAQLFRRLLTPQQQRQQFLRQQQARLRQLESARKSADKKAAASIKKASKQEKKALAKSNESSKTKKSQRQTAKSTGKKSKPKITDVDNKQLASDDSVVDIEQMPADMLGPKTLNHRGFGMTLKLINGKVVVAATSKSGMANGAGILKGDVLKSVGSMPIQLPRDITGFDEILAPGDLLDFELVRKGRAKKLMVPYKKKPAEEGKIVDDALVDAQNVNPDSDEERLEPIATTTPTPTARDQQPTPATRDQRPTPAVRDQHPTPARKKRAPLDLESLLNDSQPEKKITPPKPPLRDGGIFELPETARVVPDASVLIDSEISELKSLIEQHKSLISAANRRLNALQKRSRRAVPRPKTVH